MGTQPWQASQPTGNTVFRQRRLSESQDSMAGEAGQDMGTTCSSAAQPKRRPPGRTPLLLQAWHWAAPQQHPSAERVHEAAKGKEWRQREEEKIQVKLWAKYQNIAGREETFANSTAGYYSKGSHRSGLTEGP